MALLSDGGYSEYVMAEEGLVMPIPTGISPLQAAGIPEVWLTAYQLLFWVGDLNFQVSSEKEQKKKKVLIHAAGSGVGLAATQLASLVGAGEVLATAGSDEKLAAAQAHGAVGGWNRKSKIAVGGSGLGAESRKYERFSTWVKASTDGKGVDIILDCVGQDYVTEHLESLAMDSTWVSFGLLSGGGVGGSVDSSSVSASSPVPLLSSLLRKRASLRSTTLRSRSLSYKAKLVAEFRKNALPFFEGNKLRPTIDSVYSFDQVAQAHKRMRDNLNTGKILLVPDSALVDEFYGEKDDSKDEL
jgi:tumor protein p53-inducible protein 3